MKKKSTKDAAPSVIDAVALAKAKIMKGGRMISLKEFTGDLVKGSARWVELKGEFNTHRNLLLKSAKGSALQGTERLRLITGLISPEKHGGTISFKLAEGTPLQILAEKERAEKSRLYWQAVEGRKLPEESGLSDSEFWNLARHNGHVSASWKRESSTGNLAYNQAAQRAWLRFIRDGITAERAEKIPAPKPETPAHSAPKQKRKKVTVTKAKAA